MKEILNLGAGIQSTTVLLLSLMGKLPPLDCAIFADTQWEPPEVYAHLKRLIDMANKASVPVHIVSKGNIRADMLKARMRKEDYKLVKDGRWTTIPLYTRNPEGSIGRLRRQCTREYKITPIENFIRREILNLAKGQHAPRSPVVRQWFGISSDEVFRVNPSRAKWKEHYYPLIEDCRMSRRDCELWLEENYPDLRVLKSACIGCPYHSDADWRAIKADAAMWKDAVEFDRAIRVCGGMRGETFLHRSAQPLELVDLRSAEDRGQLNLFNNECGGMCGL